MALIIFCTEKAALLNQVPLTRLQAGTGNVAICVLDMSNKTNAFTGLVTVSKATGRVSFEGVSSLQQTCHCSLIASLLTASVERLTSA